MFKIIKSLIVLSLFIWLIFACQEKLATQESVQFNINVTVFDTSFVTQSIMNDSVVAEAKVELSSSEYNLKYQAYTDSEGVAHFENIIPGIYSVSAEHKYEAETVKIHISNYEKDINLNGSRAALELKNSSQVINLIVKPAFDSELLISEVYYNGAPKPPPYYYHDQFTEIYNNSEETLYLDGYLIGDPNYYSRPDSSDLYCVHLYQFPGDGDDYPIEAGECIFVAQDAINHLEYNAQSVDLRDADFEYYNHLSNDVDAPDVVNMIQIHHKYGHDFLHSVMNDALVLIKLDSTFSGWTYTDTDEIIVPKRFAVDGVEYKESLNEYDTKHLPDEIDAGITGGSPAYKGKSVARKVLDYVGDQAILMDTNNSTVDYVVLDTPTPGEL